MESLKYKTGDIFHCKGNGLVAKGISLFTKSEITHSAMFIICWGKPFIIEAQAKGVYIIPFYEWKKKWKYEYVVSRSPIELNDRLRALKAMSKLGHTAYDFQGLLIRMPIKLITGKWRDKPNDGEKMFCSEFVAWVYGLENNNRVSPKDLYNYCIKNNFKLI